MPTRFPRAQVMTNHSFPSVRVSQARALLWTQRIQNTRERIVKDPTSLVHKRMWWSVQLPAFLSGIQGKGLFESLKPRKGDAYADF